MKTKTETFAQILKSFSGKYDYKTLFADFLEMTVCALQIGKAEDHYLEVVGRYTKEEAMRFSQALGTLILEMGEMPDWRDPLGDFFTNEVTRGHNGQYFTPDGITMLMAQISLPDHHTFGKKVNDCACGSGRTLLSAAAVIGPHNEYYGADLDRNCAMMTAINLCLHGLAGEVVCMNSISQEWYAAWRIDMVPAPHLVAINKEECYQVLTIPNNTPQKLSDGAKAPELPNISPDIQSENATQLTLF